MTINYPLPFYKRCLSDFATLSKFTPICMPVLLQNVKSFFNQKLCNFGLIHFVDVI